MPPPHSHCRMQGTLGEISQLYEIYTNTQKNGLFHIWCNSVGITVVPMCKIYSRGYKKRAIAEKMCETLAIFSCSLQ